MTQARAKTRLTTRMKAPIFFAHSSLGSISSMPLPGGITGGGGSMPKFSNSESWITANRVLIDCSCVVELKVALSTLKMARCASSTVVRVSGLNCAKTSFVTLERTWASATLESPVKASRAVENLRLTCLWMGRGNEYQELT